MLNSFKNFFFFNVSPLVKKGRKKILTFEDLLEVPSEISLDRTLSLESINLNSKSSLIKSILGEQKHYLKRAWSFYFLGTIASLSSPFFINQFITKLTLLAERKVESSLVMPWAIGLGSIGILIGIGYQHNFYATLRAHVRITNRLNSLIFDKSLRLSQETRQKINV